MVGVGAQFSVRTLSGVGAISDQASTNASLFSFPISKPSHCFVLSSSQPKRCRFLRLRLGYKTSVVVRGDSAGRSGNGGDRRRDIVDNAGEYFEASLLLSETESHYRMRRQGFQEDTRGIKFSPFSHQRNEFQSRGDFSLVGQAFLQRFQNPTIFLKISCDGDFLLPIVVGEFAIQKLMDAHWGDENEDSPDQFQFLRNLVEKLGYQVNMVQITERVVNTYFARLYFSKPGETEILSVDARPSDAINVANRCKAPIYVNKQIVLMDAIRIGYGMGRVRDTKAVYDVSLDSASEGPDFLSQELDMVKNIDLAIKEERYRDAAMWKVKLEQLRKSIHGQ